MKIQAQNQQYQLKIEVGFSDISSLDPCDIFNNPLNKVRPPEEIKATINDLEGKVKKCMTKIDKIANKDDIGDDETINELAEEFDIDDVYVNDKIKIEIWHGYIRFLE